ncbi:hypothetical protein HUE46_01550 [Flavobacterium columnare]|uniref:hypothetical protein n=1 Tax=Flavobacterium columnare TaxID=996 RepID=UPI00177B6EF8|nr:hypothetical protein [Flavobacterium columnare]QOG88809.1 hypothetical protein HUE41_01550 [Flavobacterium columnare]QOG91468.1 hypothetical protein HUE42_01545 [Flavobacterium columnare]QOG94131.1 hypothetical protein HUE43_01550 [Flavobacterium columnare]QOG96790.1 hypothetical protein HUE44_01545 [Flavobacterium columnare]QOG99448.1 hypothetical protein HUE45_01545 [Flavobacterium columnare]
MYNFKILTKHTNSSEHLEEDLSEITSLKSGKIDFEKPWESELPKLTKEEWEVLKEKGSLEKTTIEIKTVSISNNS